MAWIYLFAASVMEVAWAVGLKYTNGLTRPWPTVLTVAAMLASFGLLAMAVRTLPIGTSYAIWTGIGAVGTAGLGMWLFKEPVSVTRLIFLGLIVTGIVGLKATSGE